MMTPPLNIFARPSLTVKLEGSLSCVEVDMGLVVLAVGLFWVGVEVEAETREEEWSLIAISCEVKL